MFMFLWKRMKVTTKFLCFSNRATSLASSCASPPSSRGSSSPFSHSNCCRNNLRQSRSIRPTSTTWRKCLGDQFPYSTTCMRPSGMTGNSGSFPPIRAFQSTTLSKCIQSNRSRSSKISQRIISTRTINYIQKRYARAPSKNACFCSHWSSWGSYGFSIWMYCLKSGLRCS